MNPTSPFSLATLTIVVLSLVAFAIVAAILLTAPFVESIARGVASDLSLMRPERTSS